MNLFELSIRSVIRKPVKSILLLLIVFVAASFIYAGWACQNASVQTQNNGKQAIGGSFRLEANEANRKKPHSVILCINGHHHRDYIRILDGVCYFDLNSASYDWVPVKHGNYPKEMCDEIRLLSNTVVYNDPIHAIITLEGTTITIEGMESSMFMDINREHTDNPIYDGAGRPVTPTVQSAKITLG